jgi:hypothetical protein
LPSALFAPFEPFALGRDVSVPARARLLDVILHNFICFLNDGGVAYRRFVAAQNENGLLDILTFYVVNDYRSFRALIRHVHHLHKGSIAKNIPNYT